jgi:dihydroorotase
LDLVSTGQLGLVRSIDSLTRRPAEILGLGSGRLSPGTVADICIFDPKACWTIDARNWISRGLNTPFFGKEMTGRVTFTLVGGKIVHEWCEPS